VVIHVGSLLASGGGLSVPDPQADRG
jgi:hypothetical protein